MLKPLIVIAALLSPMTAMAEERSVEISGGQISVPVGLTVQAKSLTVGEDATTVHVVASFDSGQTNFVNMNDSEDAYLAWGKGENQRIFLRTITDNKWMRIANGQTMEGDLVFPGVVPADATELTLVFNPGHTGDDTSAPGVTLPLKVTP